MANQVIAMIVLGIMIQICETHGWNVGIPSLQVITNINRRSALNHRHSLSWSSKSRSRSTSNPRSTQGDDALLDERKNAANMAVEIKPKSMSNNHYASVTLSSVFSFSILMATVGPLIQPASAQDIPSASMRTTDASISVNIPTPEKTLNAQTLSSTGMNKSRYFTLQSGTIDEIQFANEKLIDHAVGTVNTMFYDNTGGARFTTKDMYDRWKIMRVYGKEGAEGVTALTTTSIAKNVNERGSPNDNGAATTSAASTNTNTNDVVDADTNTIAKTNANVRQRETIKTKTERGDVFIPQLFLVEGDSVKLQKQHYSFQEDSVPKLVMPDHPFDNRDNAVKSLKWLISTLDDPYSKYLTREELENELKLKADGFLGLGAIVEPPSKTANVNGIGTNANLNVNPTMLNSALLTLTRVENLPLVTAIAPDSPAERSGIVVGDRIAAVGSDKFIGLGRDEILKRLAVYSGAENYFGYPELTIAKPQIKTVIDRGVSQVNVGIDVSETKEFLAGGMPPPVREELLGYKLSRVRLPTAIQDPYKPYQRKKNDASNMMIANGSIDGSSIAYLPSVVPPASAVETIPNISGGDNIVHWELLTPQNSIFRNFKTGLEGETSATTDKIGYIRLTRFSRLSTAGYSKAVEELDKAGAQSYIIDVRNNYGGIIQESMLTAATLLRDPHTVLCYTMNSRGGFTPHDAEEYIVDVRYPGYFLSSEPKSSTFDQVKHDNPEFVADNGGWVPPSSYASIHEQRMVRKYKPPTGIAFNNPFQTRFVNDKAADELKQLKAQKKVVILINEGTASAAEVFVSALHDNGRTVALVGTNSYGKGLIQHTFPMPDGGGLRLTVAEYLTPALQHVTKVGAARYDVNGQYVGGGVRPDIYCPSTQGIPSNIGADLCVGLAVDALEDASTAENQMAGMNSGLAGRQGGIDGGGFRRRTLTVGIVRVSTNE
eukprot:scaffold409_cov295-Chaetoceros_neogracile.AAC.14